MNTQVERRTQEVPTVEVAGIKIDRTLTVANLIQIGILLIGAGVFYNQVSSFRERWAEDRAAVAVEFDRMNASLRDLGAITNQRIDTLSGRVTAQEIDNAVMDSELKALASAIDRLSTKIEELGRSGR